MSFVHNAFLFSLFLAALLISPSFADSQLIEKYERLLLLTQEDLAEQGTTEKKVLKTLIPELNAAVKAAKRFPYDQPNKIAYFDFKVFAESEISEQRRAQNESNKRFFHFFSDILPVLAYAYLIPGDNPYYGKPEIRDLYLKGLEYCYSRGLDEKAWFSDHAGRASAKAIEAGLVRESGDFSNVSLHFGGFAQSLFLMRDVLSEAGLLDKYRKVARNIAINNGATYWAFFQHARGEAYFERVGSSPDTGPFNREAEKSLYFLNADGIRLFVDYFIPYYLLVTEPTEHRRMTEVLQNVIARNIALQPGTQDTIKPDGVGFHHHAAYVGGYSPYTFEAYATLLYLFADSAFVQRENIDAVTLALESFRVMAQKYTVSTSLKGRLLGNRDDSAAVAITKAIALLAHRNGLGDNTMSARFSEYFDPEYFFSGEPLADYYKGKRGVPIRGLGIYRIIDDLLALDAEPASTPSGSWIKPYAAAGFFRQDDWLGTTKGFSRYFWDFEGPLNKQQNSFGQNWSNGALFIFNEGHPISELDSGIDLSNGWDWYHVPGTTASHYPVVKRSDKAVKLARKEAGLPYRSVHRSYNSKTFVGGVSLGEYGLFVHDLEAVPFTSPTDLRARKTYIHVDGVILALGSHISGGTETEPTHTTLFQTKLSSPQDKTILQGQSMTGLDTDEQFTRFENGVTLSDAVGNRYFVARSSAPLRFKRQLQKSLTPNYRPTKGAYAVSYLDHGFKPNSDNYEYIVIPSDPSGSKLARIAKAPSSFYRVLDTDEMHLVHFPKQQLTAYAFYEQTETPRDQFVKSASHNATVLTRQDGRSIELAASVPDIGWKTDLNALRERGLSYSSDSYEHQEAATHQLTLSLRGQWELEPSSPQASISIQGNETSLLIHCKDGLEKNVILRPTSL